ncbi:MAG: hypothetical protein KME32_26360 [Mojavia pulchra JT2-VF2]|jgi:hypothetical protein|uniref:Uncharacterized protein n=1 Tax=Mojavia pulchra JT2-VF2 TaxID=287848 RepID=A0A951UIG4_9NOST|nr:hypothetical protein [Mojavia pulchra JT2-VF2]
MISRFVSFSLILLILPLNFFFSKPAYAHSLDYCLEILQNAAYVAINNEEKFKIKQYPEYAAIAKDCDKSLKKEGLITLSQLKDRDIANSVLNGILLAEDLDDKVKKDKETKLKQKEEDLKAIRNTICSKKNKIDDFACVSQ